MGGGEEGKGLDRELAWGGFLAELVSLIRDDLLDANVQEFEGRHVMAGDKDKEQTYRGPLSNGLFAFFQGAVGNPKSYTTHQIPLKPISSKATYLLKISPFWVNS